MIFRFKKDGKLQDSQRQDDYPEKLPLPANDGPNKTFRFPGFIAFAREKMKLVRKGEQESTNADRVG